MSGSSRFDGLERRRVQGIAVPVAEGWWVRALGLAFLGVEDAGEGLLIPGCRAVHTVGMRFRLDVAFLGREGEVVRRAKAVPAGRFVYERKADAVLEIPTRTARGERNWR